MNKKNCALKLVDEIILIFLNNRAVYEIMWKNNVELNRSQLTIRYMWIARWLPKATNRHSEYVILTAFALQQWLHERASMLPHTYIVCPVHNCKSVYCGVRNELLLTIQFTLTLEMFNHKHGAPLYSFPNAHTAEIKGSKNFLTSLVV